MPRAAPGTRTVSESRPDRRIFPGSSPVSSPWRTTSVPFTSTCSIPSAPAYSRLAPPGRSVRVRSAVTDRVRIDQHHVGPPALADLAAVAKPVEGCRNRRKKPGRLLPGYEAPLADAVSEKGCRVDRSAHHVEMCAGVGSADNRPSGRAKPSLVRPSPLRIPESADGARCGARRRRPRRASRRTGPGARLGHVADRLALEGSILGGEGLEDDQPAPVRERPEDAGFVGVSPGSEAPADLRVCERCDPGVFSADRRSRASRAARRGSHRARTRDGAARYAAR